MAIYTIYVDDSEKHHIVVNHRGVYMGEINNFKVWDRPLTEKELELVKNGKEVR